MSLEAQVFAALKGLVANRVYPLILPQGQTTPITPAIRFQFISSETSVDVCGDGGDGTANTRVQVDVYSVDFDTCRTLRQQVIPAMTAMSTPTVWDGGFDDYEPDTKLYRCSMDYLEAASGGTLACKGWALPLAAGTHTIRIYSDKPNTNGASIYALATKR